MGFHRKGEFVPLSLFFDASTLHKVKRWNACIEKNCPRSRIDVRPIVLPGPHPLDSDALLASSAPRRTLNRACSQLMTSQWQLSYYDFHQSILTERRIYSCSTHIFVVTFELWPWLSKFFYRPHNLPAAKTTASKHWRQDLVTENNTDQPHYSTVTSIHLTITELISHSMLHQTTPEKICYHCTNKLNAMTATKSRRVIHYWNKHAASSHLRALYLQKNTQCRR